LERWLVSAPRAQRFVLPTLVAYVALAGLLLLDATWNFVDEESLYERALEERPRQAWTHGFMGLALKREGRLAEAIPFLNRAATMDKSEPRYALRLGECLLESGAIEPAQRVARAGSARFAGMRAEASFLMLIARTLPSTHSDEQRALMERCLLVDPRRIDCQAALGVIDARKQNKRPAGTSARATPWD
jgi:tetratricopeptide (TPR) repeat protein